MPEPNQDASTPEPSQQPPIPEPSQHARDRMAERDITEEHIRAALTRRSEPASPGGSGKLVIRGYGEDERILKVVLTPDQKLIISVMWVNE